MARSLIGLGLGFALLAAACGGSDDEATPTAPPTTAPPTSAAVTTTTTEGRAPSGDGPTLTTSWQATAVARGAKPVLALDGSGTPAIAYLLEARDGLIAFASAADGWVEDVIAAGYFYGPIGLSFGPSGDPNVVYHDHQDLQFQENLGDLTHAVRRGGEWTITAAEDAGHDGWDSTIAVGPDGTVHAAGIDPQQFGSTVGVEYYLLGDDGEWQVTPIGSGGIEYEWNVSLAVKPDGTPALTFFDNNTQDLRYAELVGGAWTIETVAADGDVGRFSSLAFDADGAPHVSFYEATGPTAGNVLYATRTGSGWTVEAVGALDDVFIDFAGARRITSIGVGPDGAPRIAFSDESNLVYAVSGDGGWATEIVASAGDLPLGQLVSLAIDAAGTPHLATFEVTDKSPVDGTVVYLTPGV